MQKFDFISDGKLRTALEADYAELQNCLEHSAWKSAHVLVGSLIEALLVDYLISSGYQLGPNQDILKFDLGQLIEACKTQGALTDKTRELSVVVKSYRNLIHPGRLIRLKEKVNKDSANVAKSLLNMIVEEITELKTQQFGYNAEQILSKIEKDSSSISIMPHLMKDMQEQEILRLLSELIPARYFEIQAQEWFDGDDAAKLERFAKVFRIIFDGAGVDTRTAVTRRFLSVVKESEHKEIFVYEDKFFRATDLQYLTPSGVGLVKNHLIARLGESRTPELIITMHGIEKFITVDDVRGLVDPLIKEVIYGKNTSLKFQARTFFVYLWNITSQPIEGKIMARLEDWQKLFGEKGQTEHSDILKAIADEMIPF